MDFKIYTFFSEFLLFFFLFLIVNTEYIKLYIKLINNLEQYIDS